MGLEAAIPGARVSWQVEQDEFCRGILAKHWPEAGRFEDVRTVGAANLEPVDIICGGFPCQDSSGAGRGGGLAGERSGLWWEFARVIRELAPRIIVVENVSALTNRGLDAVLGEMASGGYNAEWDIISAASVGAWHRHERLFVVAYSNSAGRSKQRGTSASQAQQSAFEQHSGWATEPGMGRVANGVPNRVAKLKALGNAVVPQCAYIVGQRVAALLDLNHLRG